MFHVICIFIVLLLRTNPHPEEILRLLPLIYYLGNKAGSSETKFQVYTETVNEFTNQELNLCVRLLTAAVLGALCASGGFKETIHQGADQTHN